MHQPNSPAVDEVPDLTVQGRKRKSAEAVDRARLSRAYQSAANRDGKIKRPPKPESQMSRAEFVRRVEQDKEIRDERYRREQTRRRRLLFLFEGRREQALRTFDDGSHKCREVDQSVFVPYVFSFELWLLEERCGWRERNMRPDDFCVVWYWWRTRLTWKEQIDEMLLRRDKR